MGSLLFCLSGCQHKKSENYNIMLNSKSDVLPIYAENDKEISNKTSDLASLEDVDAGYNVEEWKCENEPNGIICLEDSIMISDKASDAIIQMDYSGKKLERLVMEKGSFYLQVQLKNIIMKYMFLIKEIIEFRYLMSS